MVLEVTRGQVTALAVAALAVFWMVGAYNRLVALRNAIARAWQAVDDVQKKRGEALLALAAALRGPLDGEHGALDTLVAAVGQGRQASEALAARPVAATLAAQWSAAEAALAAASARVLALAEHQPELREAEGVAAPLAAVKDSAGRLAFSRQVYNEAAQNYTAAVQQFPTRLLTRLFGFAPAGRL